MYVDIIFLLNLENLVLQFIVSNVQLQCIDVFLFILIVVEQCNGIYFIVMFLQDVFRVKDLILEKISLEFKIFF